MCVQRVLSPTGKLCTWVENVQLQVMPEGIKTRAKNLILDGIGCGLATKPDPESALLCTTHTYSAQDGTPAPSSVRLRLHESMVKRMQHGFAARNGLFAALMAQQGYIGIKKVFERDYGGYLACFGCGSGESRRIWLRRVKSLGLCGRRVKFADLKKIERVVIELGEVAYHHGGWEARRPLKATGAQMSSITCAVQSCYAGKRQCLGTQRQDGL
ncbi:hypothetical protein BDV96DRAFT_604262 [Lophiotrema nucula]|uniref:MmgE/PrpD N-terminal domain-containing protein n=1 Tax=Lophiotrema nucula TaxID=690887 RepID=A0A6A5YVS2_9PLEO|nr:hypothetical protein BDV96DRAFT_604262 [Lophiotrema nucula]